ncbi:MAG TPA: HD domain-containing protein [Anaerolineales bacterium]|nr:HD domain-containing protein [Anaerolineales bacterium]
MSLPYRVVQFVRALTIHASPQQHQHVFEILEPPLAELFFRMTPFDQAHSLRVLAALQLEGQTDPDLLAAALLHDVGKSVHSPSVLDRIIAVLANQLLPRMVLKWGASGPHGWRRPFAITVQHPVWGAELAAAHGASTAVVDLIRLHQHPLPVEPRSAQDTLLKELRRVDSQY